MRKSFRMSKSKKRILENILNGKGFWVDKLERPGAIFPTDLPEDYPWAYALVPDRNIYSGSYTWKEFHFRPIPLAGFYYTSSGAGIRIINEDNEKLKPYHQNIRTIINELLAHQ